VTRLERPTSVFTVKITAVLSVVSIATGVAGCTNDHTAPTSLAARTSTAAAPSVSPAFALCDAALPGRTRTAQETTLEEVRHTNIGGPPPGLVPGRDAFPGEPANKAAAWCWVLASGSPSPGETGNDWTLYVAINGGRAQALFTAGTFERPPTGPPQIP
jgi:hypothetical protein